MFTLPTGTWGHATWIVSSSMAVSDAGNYSAVAIITQQNANFLTAYLSHGTYVDITVNNTTGVVSVALTLNVGTQTFYWSVIKIA
jgi:hypothetical protein